jgi:hypothetical protein
MSKPKKRNKKYVPKARPSLPITFGVPKEAMTQLALMPHACIESFIAGQANEANAYTLANVSNLCALLARNHSTEAQTIAKSGQDAMISVISRGEHGAWGFSGGEYQDIKACVTLCDELTSSATRRELRDMLVKLMNSM